jgi:glycosyltransferase involved in cell wall biosynthesis
VISVACLCPTIPAHEQFLQAAVDSLHAQRYPAQWDVFLHIDGDPVPTLGAKINSMVRHCLEISAVDYFVLCDSDDLHHPDRIRKQVQPMVENPKLLLTGTSVLTYRNQSGEIWQYRGLTSAWIGGLAFSVKAWKRYQFPDISAGTDTNWQRKFASDTRLDLRDGSLLLCNIHSTNTCRKTTVGREWSRLSELPSMLRGCV